MLKLRKTERIFLPSQVTFRRTFAASSDVLIHLRVQNSEIKCLPRLSARTSQRESSNGMAKASDVRTTLRKRLCRARGAFHRNGRCGRNGRARRCRDNQRPPLRLGIFTDEPPRKRSQSGPRLDGVVGNTGKKFSFFRIFRTGIFPHGAQICTLCV